MCRKVEAVLLRRVVFSAVNGRMPKGVYVSMISNGKHKHIARIIKSE